MGKESFALITGLFLSTLAIATVIIIIWLGDFQTLTNDYVVATRGSVTGLKLGSTVYYRGLNAGKVKAIHFDPNDPQIILIPISIDRQIKLSKGVFAVLKLKGVTGLTQIALADSGENPEPLSASERIPIKPSLLDRLSDSGEHILLQTDALLTRIKELANEENEQHMRHILSNVEIATGKFIELQDQANQTLAELPVLIADAQKTLGKVDNLTDDFKSVAQQLKIISPKIGGLVESGNTVSDMLVTTTLPRVNVLLIDLQSTTQRFNRVAAMLENDPQAFLLGHEITKPGPGEPGYRETQ